MEAGQRHQIIESLVSQYHTKDADAAIALWTPLAIHVISIVGEAGFDSLYARSEFLAQLTFPWLVMSAPSLKTGHRFAALTASFEGQPPDQARAANCLLLITFTNIMASLIGEALTTRMLSSAWRYDAPSRVGKELSNE